MTTQRLQEEVTERRRAEEEIRQYTAQLEVLHATTLDITATRPLPILLRTIVKRAARLLDTPGGRLYLCDPDRQQVRCVVSYNTPRDYTGTVLKYGEGVAGTVALTEEPLIIDDYRAWSKQAAVYEEEQPFIAILMVPMIWQGRVIGMISVLNDVERCFTRADLELLTLFANHAAIAVENARMYEQAQQEIAERERAEETLRRRNRELALLNRAGQAFNSILDLDQVLVTVLEEVCRLLGVVASSVWLIDSRTDELVCWQATGPQSETVRGWRLAPGEGVASWVARTGESLIVPDTQADDRYFEGVDQQTGLVLRSILSVPLQVKHNVIGALQVADTEVDRFRSTDLSLLEALATTAAIAIENARLYEQVRHRIESLTNLNRSSQVVISSLDVEEVLERIVNLAGSVVNSDYTSVILLDEEEKPVREAEDFRGMQPISQRIRTRGVTRHVLDSGQPVLVDDISDKGEMSPPLRRPDGELMKANPVAVAAGIRSFAATPIQTKGRTVGILFVHSLRPRAFHGQFPLLTTFANQAAAAIENARLHRQVLDHAAQLEQRVQERTAELQVQYARLDAILHGITDGIVVTDGRGRILQANPVTQTWLTQTLSPADATRLRQTVRDLARQVSAGAAGGERPKEVLELTGLDLELKAAPISPPPSSPRNRGGREGGEATAVVAVHDVSHLKALDRIKSRFVSNVSHDLRTPITTIKLYAYLMEQSPEKWEEYLTPLTQEADHQARLVEDILQISRIDAGRLEIKPGPTGLNELTEATIVKHQVLAQDRGLALEHQPAEPGPVALVDPERMIQVLNNLVENAIRYTPVGGRVVVSTGKKEAESQVWATAVVTDTGMGIPEEELPHIFDRFFRGVEPRSMQISGTGLGLAIVKEIVELHGGWVTVESRVGVGTTFTVWLPLVC